ncbi:MAG: DUF1998 domain-containing protein [Bacteroidetes bacterium]|nr:DUF1998 domain-containing protein [Bacteroidota bacterium]
MIVKSTQYNEPVDKSKIISSTSGVGSIIVSKMGYYFLIDSIDHWPFIRNAKPLIRTAIEAARGSNFQAYKAARSSLIGQGITIIDDFRFIEYLRTSLGLNNLTSLIEIPSMSLIDYSNEPNWENHPIRQILPEEVKATSFMLTASHFPKWFKNGFGRLMKYDKWKIEWTSKHDTLLNRLLPEAAFVPPRDSNGIVKKGGKDISVKYFDKQIKLYRQLEQLNLILICRNGHLSDIPWSKYLRWKTQLLLNNLENEQNDNGSFLFRMKDCCSRPELKWSESKTRGEGFGSVFLECTACKMGSGEDNSPKVSLDGINNLKPFCIGEKPWEWGISWNNDNCHCAGNPGQSEHMQVSLVTGNSVYFPLGKSSLFIPRTEEINHFLLRPIEVFYKRRIENDPTLSRVQIWNSYYDKIFLEPADRMDYALDNGLEIGSLDAIIEELRISFLNAEATNALNDEEYRAQEYTFFSNKDSYSDAKLTYDNVDLPESLMSYFAQIKRIGKLCVTKVQAGFSRVTPYYEIEVNGATHRNGSLRPIYSGVPEEVYAIPGWVSYGEGIFVVLDQNKIKEWESNLPQDVYEYFFNRQLDSNESGYHLKQDLLNKGPKKLLIHTLSHLLMRELEYSCGYPTASLVERLYISDTMSGFLIYTVDGSEGSMGGLIQQATPSLFSNLFGKSLRRAMSCSADPLCWLNEPNGLYNLNLASCFSCSMVSETACEEMNLSLDRRALIDEKFGFFKDLL